MSQAVLFPSQALCVRPRSAPGGARHNPTPSVWPPLLTARRAHFALTPDLREGATPARPCACVHDRLPAVFGITRRRPCDHR